MSSGNLMGFDASKVEPVSFDVLPAGDYIAAIVKSEVKPTKDGSGQRLNLQLQVLEGQYKGRVLFDGINIANKSPKAQQIGQGQLSAICRAVNVQTPRDSSDLHNKPLTISVKIEKDDKGADRNVVKSHKSVSKQSSLVEQAFEQASQPAERKSPWA
jgi:hypothetical protein